MQIHRRRSRSGDTPVTAPFSLFSVALPCVFIDILKRNTGALAAVLAGDAVALLEDTGLFAVGIERAGERSLEAGLVHAALRRVDVVGERHDDLVIAVVILQRDLAHGVAALAGHIDGLGVIFFSSLEI